MFGDVLVQRWHWRKSRFARLSPLPELPVSRNRSGSVVSTWAPQRRLTRGAIYFTLEENASLDNKKPEWTGATSACLQKKSANPSGVIFETGSVHRWVGYVSPLSVRQIHKSRYKPNKHTIYRTDTGIKLHLILFFFFTFLLSSWLVSTKVFCSVFHSHCFMTPKCTKFSYSPPPPPKKKTLSLCFFTDESDRSVPHVPFHTKYPSQTAVAVSL